jgi:hypothetical protein
MDRRSDDDGLNFGDITPELRISIALATLQEDVLCQFDETVLNTLDWRLLVDICGRHKLVQPLMDVLREPPCPVPDWVRPALWVRLQRNRTKAQRHIEELCRLSDLLNDSGIKFRVMRGPALSMLAFGVADKREFCDLDVVVDLRNVDRTRRLLEQDGYYTPPARRPGIEQNCAYQMTNTKQGGGVDLHWSVVPTWLPVGIPFDAMTRPPVWIDINDHQIPTFAKEETLLIQCVQCMKTAWVELDRWHDFAVLCDQWDDVDWDRVIRLCRDHRYLRSLALTLHLVGPKVCRHIPGRVLQQLTADAGLRRAVPLILPRLPEAEVNNLPEQGHTPETMALGREYLPYWFYHVFRVSKIQYPIATWWLVTDDPGQRRSYILWIIRFHLSPKQADYNAIKLPEKLNGLYYVVRPVRLMLREIQGLARKIMPQSR